MNWIKEDGMKVYFLKQKALDMLEKEIPDNIEKYEGTEQWAETYFASKEMPNYYFDTGIEVPDYQLVAGGPENDFQNAKIIYEAFSQALNPVQASDLRLWAYLAHVQHWNYMNMRWKIDVPDEEDEKSDIRGNNKQNEEKKTQKRILDRIGYRYFFKASRGKAFVRHGISRLYWSAYLTYDKDNDNPYEYTEYFFSKQDIFTSITERSYARNKILVLAALKELKAHPELGRTEIRLFLAKLNQAGAIVVLDFLNKTQAEKLCAEVMTEVVNVKEIQEGSRFKAYDNLTGKKYGADLLIINSGVVDICKVMMTKPHNLIGKKVGSQFTISGRKYVIKNIQ